MKILLSLLLCASAAHAGTTITPTATGLTFAQDGVTRTNLDSAVYATIAGVKKLLAAQPSCDLGPVLAAIKAIPSGTPVVTPPPPPPPPAGPSGVFIGTTQYDSLSAAGGAYKSGDTIHITKSLDNDSTALVNGDVTVICDPGVKLTWSAGYSKRIAWGKGFFNIEGTTQNATIKGCTMDGAVLDINSGGNAACVRINDGVGGTVTLDGIQCTNSDNGVLGAAKTTIVSNSKFWNNGVTRKGYTHNVYFSAYADSVTVTGSYFGPVDQGNIFKSRAKTLTINQSTFESNATRDSSYVIDISNGGAVSVKNSVIVKGPGQSQRYILSYAPEGLAGDGRGNSYEFKNNTVVSDMNGAFINGAAGAMTFDSNTLVGAFDQLPAMTNTKAFADRASAGLQPAPSVPALPAAVMAFKK